MTTTDIDYEVEYNNRARVPEHPQKRVRGPVSVKQLLQQIC